MTVLVEGSL